MALEHITCSAALEGGSFFGGPPPPRVKFRRVVVPLRGPGQSPVLPFACCVGSLRSVGRCGRCSCRCRFRVRPPIRPALPPRPSGAEPLQAPKAPEKYFDWPKTRRKIWPSHLAPPTPPPPSRWRQCPLGPDRRVEPQMYRRHGHQGTPQQRGLHRACGGGGGGGAAMWVGGAHLHDDVLEHPELDRGDETAGVDGVLPQPERWWTRVAGQGRGEGGWPSTTRHATHATLAAIRNGNQDTKTERSAVTLDHTMRGTCSSLW